MAINSSHLINVCKFFIYNNTPAFIGLRGTVPSPHISRLYRYNVASKMNLFDKINDTVIVDILK